MIFICSILAGCGSDSQQEAETGKNEGVKKGQIEETKSSASADEKLQAAKEDAPEQDTEQKDDKPQADKDKAKQINELPPLTDRERRLANQVLDFSNQARQAFNKGYYSLGETLRLLAIYYQEKWDLPGRPKIGSQKEDKRKLTPPKGLFNSPDEAALTKALQGMDRSLTQMLKDFDDLAKYVADDSIRDNGKKGVALSKKILGEHANYLKARKSWLEIVNQRAAQAETALLAEHPLRRQITGAGRIFEAIDEIDAFLQEKKPPRQIINDLQKSLALDLKEAERPPFPAAPALERLFRDFTKTVQTYNIILERAVAEGLHDLQKRELAQAGRQCRAAYEVFARAAAGN